MLYVIQKPPRVALPIVGTSHLFPVRRVFCVGRNYAATPARWAPTRTGSRRSSS
jgi:2-keto-4-pentenoate hydratase/2-oxohepta-3-ene-1,7-dioic acid hydratase in catechol pathway